MAQQRNEQSESGGGGGRQGSREGLARRGSPFGEMGLWGESPFRRALAEMDWMFDQLQRSLFGAPWGRGERMLERTPHIDMEETDDAMMVRVEIPGVDPKDLNVDFRDGVLTVRGESRREEGDQERGAYARSYASFYRQVALPPDVDVDRAQATCRNGVLSIRFPRTEQAQHVKRIPITTEGREATAEGREGAPRDKAA